MDSTIQALGGLLLRAVPTFILVFLLHFYLKWMFFTPLNKVLKERRNLTEGAREAADAALRAANEKTATYEAALNDARAEIHRIQEETRNGWLAEQTRQMDEARARSHALILKGKEEIAAEAETARRELKESTQALAAQLTQRFLAGRLN